MSRHTTKVDWKQTYRCPYDGKRIHDNREYAYESLARSRFFYLVHALPFELNGFYKCPDGGGWHLTKKEQVIGHGSTQFEQPVVILIARPDLVPLLVNPLDATRHSTKSFTRVEWRCDKGHIYGRSVTAMVTDGPRCGTCLEEMRVTVAREKNISSGLTAYLSAPSSTPSVSATQPGFWQQVKTVLTAAFSNRNDSRQEFHTLSGSNDKESK